MPANANTDTNADRGDDFVPTDDDADPKKAEVTDEDLKKVGVDDPEAKDESKAEKAEKDEPKADDKDDKDPKKAAPRIPLARHEAILSKERERREAVERELAQTRQGQQVAATNEQIAKAEDDLLKLEANYTKLLADGEVDKASKLMADIRKMERSINESRNTFMIQAAETRAYERVRYDTTVERLEAAYPALNPDHADFDEALTTEVVELRDAYVATGKYGRAEAIQKAAKTLMGTSTVRQETAVTADVRVDKEDLAKAAAEERRKAAREKAADASQRQPPNTKSIGLDSDKMGTLDAKQVMKMSQDEFAKLDEKALAKLRGDEITA